MYNYKLKKIDPLSSFKFGILFSSAISVIAMILLFFYNIINSTILAFGPELFINTFIRGFIRLFFTALMFGIGSLIFSAICAFAAYIFNLSIAWSEGLKVELEGYEEIQEEEQTTPAKEETSAVIDEN